MCQTNFEDKYGHLGKNFIEVHHKTPISQIKKERDVNPRTDMVVLCSNCHSMIHRKRDEILTVEELKKIYNASAKKIKIK